MAECSQVGVLSEKFQWTRRDLRPRRAELVMSARSWAKTADRHPAGNTRRACPPTTSVIG